MKKEKKKKRKKKAVERYLVENARERGFLRIGRFVVRVGGFCEVGGGIVLLCVACIILGVGVWEGG